MLLPPLHQIGRRPFGPPKWLDLTFFTSPLEDSPECRAATDPRMDGALHPPIERRRPSRGNIRTATKVARPCIHRDRCFPDRSGSRPRAAPLRAVTISHLRSRDQISAAISLRLENSARCERELRCSDAALARGNRLSTANRLTCRRPSPAPLACHWCHRQPNVHRALPPPKDGDLVLSARSRLPTSRGRCREVRPACGYRG